MINENTPTLETDRLLLRKFNASDLADVLAIHSDEQVNRFLPWFTIDTIEQAQEYLAGVISQYDNDIAYAYAIELKNNGKVVGYVNVSDVGCANDLGYGLSREYWRQGIAAEACGRIIEHLQSVNFPYLTATHDINNPNSGRVMRKIGMAYKYTYEELVQPKNQLVNFRMYQINLDGDNDRTYLKYWNASEKHRVEKL